MADIKLPPNVCFADWIIDLMQYWYPDRSVESIQRTVQSFYDWQQVWPDKSGSLPSHLMSKITNMAILYRSMDYDH